MAISKKGKRKISVNSRQYLWWVYDEYSQADFNGNQIEIVAVNQAGYFKYGLEQEAEKRYVVITLRHQAYKVHVKCPQFEDDNGIIKPSGIARLIKWCFMESTDDNQELVHAYSAQTGIIPEADRLKTLKIILDQLQNV